MSSSHRPENPSHPVTQNPSASLFQTINPLDSPNKWSAQHPSSTQHTPTQSKEPRPKQP